MLFYRAALPLSSRTLNYTAGLIRRHRKAAGSRWRKLNPTREALLVLAYLRKGETFEHLAVGFGIGRTTAWRYVNETVELLAARAPKLRQAVRDAKRQVTPTSSSTAPSSRSTGSPATVRSTPAVPGYRGRPLQPRLMCVERGNPVMVRRLRLAVGRSQEGRNTRRERMAGKRIPAAERQRETKVSMPPSLRGGAADNRPDTGRSAGPERELT
jgi:hypothetical protein